MADITKITPNTLINAERVEGTSVYNPQGDKLGTIDDIMWARVSVSSPASSSSACASDSAT